MFGTGAILRKEGISMTLRTWDPVRQLEALRRDIERAFEDNETWKRPFSRYAFLPALGARNYPLLNVSEDSEHVYVEAMAPGLNPEALEISVLQGQLRIAGEKPGITPEVKPEAYHRNERSAGRFVRTVNLPTDVDGDRVTAQYKNGLLLVTLPKAEAAKPKQIRVDVS